MRTTTRTAEALFADVLTGTAALDLLHETLDAQVIPQPRWREFDDREAYEAQLHIDIAEAGLPGSDW